MGNGEVLENQSKDFVYLIIEFVLSGLLVFSLIQIFRKKVNGKAFFVGFSILLIAFQFYTSGIHPWVKYALEVLMVLIIAPVRMKSKKNRKVKPEDSASVNPSTENPTSEAQALDTVQEHQDSASTESSNQPLG